MENREEEEEEEEEVEEEDEEKKRWGGEKKKYGEEKPKRASRPRVSVAKTISLCRHVYLLSFRGPTKTKAVSSSGYYGSRSGRRGRANAVAALRTLPPSHWVPVPARASGTGRRVPVFQSADH